jgi:hypothetical protein
MKTKICSKCKKEKFLDEFRNNLKGKFQKKAYCIICDDIYQKELYLRHRELRIIKSKEWNDQHPNEIKQYQQNFRDKFNKV